MKPLALSLIFAASWTCGAQTVRIAVVTLFRPARLEVRGAVEVQAGGEPFALEADDIIRCAARNGTVECTIGGRTFSARSVLAFPREGDDFTLTVPGRIERRFRGTLEITADSGVLIPVASMDRETAVAAVVAAESPPGAPRAALEAQAVVARSFYAAGSRHRGFDFCDTTHCQFLRQPPPSGSAAASAARATGSLILTWRGAPVAALYSARCGGRTRALPGAAPDEYPFFAVPCPYCARARPSSCTYCTRTGGAWANRRGAGAGHGIGLCQYGAAVMASDGAGFSAILERYFPNTALISKR